MNYKTSQTAIQWFDCHAGRCLRDPLTTAKPGEASVGYRQTQDKVRCGGSCSPQSIRILASVSAVELLRTQGNSHLCRLYKGRDKEEISIGSSSCLLKGVSLCGRPLYNSYTRLANGVPRSQHTKILASSARIRECLEANDTTARQAETRFWGRLVLGVI